MNRLSEATRQRIIIRKHYGLTRVVTAQEVDAEVRNLQRRANAGTLDSKQQLLAAALGISMERSAD